MIPGLKLVLLLKKKQKKKKNDLTRNNVEEGKCEPERDGFVYPSTELLFLYSHSRTVGWIRTTSYYF